MSDRLGDPDDLVAIGNLVERIRSGGSYTIGKQWADRLDRLLNQLNTRGVDTMPVSQLAHAAIVRGGFEPEFGTYDVQRPGPLYRLVEERSSDPEVDDGTFVIDWSKAKLSVSPPTEDRSP